MFLPGGIPYPSRDAQAVTRVVVKSATAWRMVTTASYRRRAHRVANYHPSITNKTGGKQCSVVCAGEHHAAPPARGARGTPLAPGRRGASGRNSAPGATLNISTACRRASHYTHDHCGSCAPFPIAAANEMGRRDFKKLQSMPHARQHSAGHSHCLLLPVSLPLLR